MTIIAKGHTARIIAAAASVVLSRSQLRLPQEWFLWYEHLDQEYEESLRFNQRAFPDFLDNSNNNQFINFKHREILKINSLAVRSVCNAARYIYSL